MTTTARLTALHDHYVEAVNMAVADDNLRLVDQLAGEYDAETRRLVAQLVDAA